MRDGAEIRCGWANVSFFLRQNLSEQSTRNGEFTLYFRVTLLYRV